MKKNNEYRFNHKDLYLCILQIKKKSLKSSVKRDLRSMAKKSPINIGMHSSAPYRVSFGLVQGLLQLKSQEIEAKGVLGLYDHRSLKKIALIFIESMSVCGIGYSPLWLLAILNELTQGDMSYTNTIQNELKKLGLLNLDDHYESTTDLLESFLDKPYIDPSLVSIQSLNKINADLRKLALKDKVKLESIRLKLTTIWEKMYRMSSYENFSINQMNGMITLDVIRKLKAKGIPATETTLITLINNSDSLIYETIIESMSELTSTGRKDYLFRNIKSFVDYYSIKSK